MSVYVYLQVLLLLLLFDDIDITKSFVSLAGEKVDDVLVMVKRRCCFIEVPVDVVVVVFTISALTMSYVNVCFLIGMWRRSAVQSSFSDQIKRVCCLTNEREELREKKVQ